MNAIAEALKKAEQEKRKKNNGGNGSGLPDLSQFTVEEKTPEQVMAEAEEAKKKDEWCRNAAPLLLKIRQRISVINLVAQHGPLSDNLSAEIADLKKKEEALLMAGGDSSLANHLSFSVFLEEIKEAEKNHEMAKIILGRVVEMGRYTLLSKAEGKKVIDERKRTGKLPIGVQIFEQNVYVPFEPDEGETKSKGQMALESVLGDYLREVRKATVKDRNVKMKVIEKAGGDINFDALNKGVPGIYLFKKTGEKKIQGTLRVELYEWKFDKNTVKFLRVLGAGGYYNHLDKAIGEVFISYSLFKKGQPLPMQYLKTGNFPEGRDHSKIKETADAFETMLNNIPVDKQDVVRDIVIALKGAIREYYSLVEKTAEEEVSA